MTTTNKSGDIKNASSSTSSSSKDDVVDPSRILNMNVGVLGHVDSGKTSLVKTLSTLLSTAALDKSSQSRQRGITLDLGFSAFLLPDLPPNFSRFSKTYDRLQVTLVDCPGHAGLIRTIIGGASIIDAVLLVVDATKGIQTQTAECAVIAEMTSATSLVVALNKVDLFPEDERDEAVAKVGIRVKKALRRTRFSEALTIVPVSAAVGGEKVAAVNVNGGGSHGGAGRKHDHDLPSYNVNGLLEALTNSMAAPDRREGRDNGDVNDNHNNHNDNDNASFQPKFHFAVDHCFPIRGQGTVITGTCLSGGASVGDAVEFPHLGLQRKIKSVQMFRRPVKTVRQGDRAGICLTNLDPSLLERGVACAPGSIRLMDAGIALVRKVRFFRGSLVSGTKFHVSVGHTTVMATLTFWGATELDRRYPQYNRPTLSADDAGVDSQATRNVDVNGLPRLPFDFDQEFLHQDQLLESLGGEDGGHGHHTEDNDEDNDNEENDETINGEEGRDNPNDNSGRSQPQPSKTKKGLKPMLLHWAMLQFQSPVYCPLDSLVIGSRLDTDIKANTCRLAFSGRLIQKCDPKKDAQRIRTFVWKEKVGTICRLGEPYRRSTDGAVVRYEVYGHNLFKKETPMAQFIGIKLLAGHPDDVDNDNDNNNNNDITTNKHKRPRQQELGVIQSSFGTAGKFKVHFPAGTTAPDGARLVLRYKRYIHGEASGKKKLHQDDPTMNVPDAVPGEKIVVEPKKSSKKKKTKNKDKDKDKDKAQPPPQPPQKSTQPQKPTQPPPKPTQPQAPASTQTPVQRSKPLIREPSPSQAGGNNTTTTTSSALPAASPSPSTHEEKDNLADRRGTISSMKGQPLEDGSHEVVIVVGFFTPEEDIRLRIGWKVVLLDKKDTTEENTGTVEGSFGKAGKCKVRFSPGRMRPDAVGRPVALRPPDGR